MLKIQVGQYLFKHHHWSSMQGRADIDEVAVWTLVHLSVTEV